MSSQDSPERALLITAEKVRMQYRNMPTAFIGSAVISSLMGVALLTGAGLEKTIGWMAVVYLWVIARFIQWRAFNRIAPTPREMRLWRRMGIGGSALAGLIWGVGAVVLYVPNGLAYQLFLVMGLVGMSGGLRLCIRLRHAVLLRLLLSEHPAAGHPVSARTRFATCHYRFAHARLPVADDAVCAARLSVDR